MAPLKPINVLISLHRGYGLGDAVQMSAVLRHVAKARPHWQIDLQAEPGRHCVGRGIVARTFEFGSNPDPDKHYDAEVEILLYDTWANWHDRPNTRVSSCLHERFGLGWDPSCARYRVDVSRGAEEMAQTLVRSGRFVAVHYEGDSSPTKKNLTHTQANEICLAIKNLRCEPVILDWRNKSPLPFRRIMTPSQWGRDAEMVCAVIAQCEAFVGIDSGPSKCASATETPTLVVWTGHHPAPFHDPAPNTTHLVPAGYHGLEPVCCDPGVIEFFEANYNVRQYARDPVPEVARWLREVLE
jgi:hypothetical protein